MKSCHFVWKIYIGAFIFVTVISSLVVIEGRPQQQYRGPYNSFNITLVPYPVLQYQHQQEYQHYNQQYQHQQNQFHQNHRISRNISLSNGSNNPLPSVSSNQHQHQQQPQDTSANSRYQPHYQQNPIAFNRKEFNGHNQPTQYGSFLHEDQNSMNDSKSTGVSEDENLRRDVRNSTVTHLPASGPVPIAKEKTRILTHHVNPSRGSLSEDLRGSTQDIIFPDSFENLFDPITRIETMPQCARGALYCEDIPTYPYHQIKDTLRRTSVNADLFFDDEVDAPKEIINRISVSEGKEKFICKSLERTIYPKVGMTKNNKWKYIINQNQEGYIQGVRVETCLYSDRPCDLSEHMPLGVVTSCKQKYVTRRMMSLADDGVPLPDIFLMPSACCCSYRMENPLLRPRNVDTTTAEV